MRWIHLYQYSDLECAATPYLTHGPDAPYGCSNPTHTCAIYFPPPSSARDFYGTNMKATGGCLEVPPSPSLASNASQTADCGPRQRSEAPAAITPPPSNDGSILCCEENSDKCTIQPTTCVDKFNHPVTDLCKGLCPNDPMTLKCTDGMDSHCNQVNLESPLEYVGIVEDPPKPRWRRGRRDSGGITASGVARAWMCGPSIIPAQVLTTSIESSTRSPDGDRHTIDSTAIDSKKTIQTVSFENTSAVLSTGSTAIPILTSHPAESLPADTPANTEVINSGQGQNSSDAEDVYDCDLEDDDDCCTEVDANVREQDPCDEECFEIVPRFMSLGQEQRRRRSQGDSARVVDNKGVFTKVVTITKAVRPVVTVFPASAAPGVTITEAIFIASTTYANQSSRRFLSEATRALTIVPPNDIATSSSHPKTSSGPRIGVSKAANDQRRLSPGAIGAIIGSVLGALLLIGLSWCYCYYFRGRGARRLREYRESNHVGIRITSNNSEKYPRQNDECGQESDASSLGDPAPKKGNFLWKLHHRNELGHSAADRGIHGGSMLPKSFGRRLLSGQQRGSPLCARPMKANISRPVHIYTSSESSRSSGWRSAVSERKQTPSVSTQERWSTDHEPSIGSDGGSRGGQHNHGGVPIGWRKSRRAMRSGAGGKDNKHGCAPGNDLRADERQERLLNHHTGMTGAHGGINRHLNTIPETSIISDSQQGISDCYDTSSPEYAHNIYTQLPIRKLPPPPKPNKWPDRNVTLAPLPWGAKK